MILFFSATGNSRYVAEKLVGENERLIFIPAAVDGNQYEFNIKNGEKLGIISPTYCWTLPSVVSDYLDKLRLHFDKKPYTYYVGTFGTTTGAASVMAEKYMKKIGCPFDAMFDVKMPDTWTPMYDLSDKEHVKKINEEAEENIRQVRAWIEQRAVGKHMHITTPCVTGVVGKKIYDEKVRKTKNLIVEDTCIGCGLCARRCPVHAIQMENRKPVWVKPECSMCLGCLHRCPKFAIQYGSRTGQHGQYVHP